MKDIKGHTISSLPISGLKKVSDLIDFEGPILSHFISEKNIDYLFYWVDFDENFNRWLVWKVTKFELYNYITGILSLQNLLLSEHKDFIYSVEIDSGLNYSNINALDVDEIAEEYIPEEDSYYKFEVNPIYKEFLIENNPDLYLQKLKENAIYLKLAPVNPKFKTTVSISYAGDFLKKLSNSFNKFMDFSFYNTFKNVITDLNTLNKTLRQIKSIKELRMIDAVYGSFEVGITVDNLYEVDKQFKDWQKNIFDDYKNDVINVDYNSEEKINEIIDKYPEQVRSDIYKPYFDLANNNEYSLTIKDVKHKKYKRIDKISDTQINRIITTSQKEEIEEQKELVNILIEKPKGKEISRISPKTLTSGLLFSEIISNYLFHINQVETEKAKLSFNRSLDCLLELVKNNYTLTNDFFDIKVESNDKNELIKMFYEKIVYLYLYQGDSNLIIKKKFDEILENIEIKE